MLNKIINGEVLKGVLPIAFFNSKIISLENENHNKNKKKVNSKILNNKYKQIEFPEPNSNILISKIYDFF